MKFDHLSNERLHSETKAIVEKERMTTIEVLMHLRDNEKRMLYAQMGYRDLKEYCVKELKYSEGSAWRRISAMRLLKELPSLEAKIQGGELNLTQISMAQAHFRETKPNEGEKKNILLVLENQNIRTTERILAERKPEALVTSPPVREKAIRGQRLEVTFVIDEVFLRDLEEIQILLGKPLSKLELFKQLTSEKLCDLRTKSGVNAKTKKCIAQPAPKISRYISKATRQQIKDRDGNRCQYQDPISKRQCEAQHHLQVEHREPFARNGKNNPENLELLCPVHNRLRAVEKFGAKKMKCFVKSLL